jgi:hypothetical protein
MLACTRVTHQRKSFFIKTPYVVFPSKLTKREASKKCSGRDAYKKIATFAGDVMDGEHR